MVQSIGNTVQWPLPVYNKPDIGVEDARFAKIVGQKTTTDIQVFPGFANNGDYFLVQTDYGTTGNYIKYYNSAMSLQWTKNETEFQFSSGTKTAISGITLQGSELFVLVSDASSNTTGTNYNLAKVVADGTVTDVSGGAVSSGSIGYMGATGYLSKPLGKSNFYVTGYRSAIEINASNGAVVESFASNGMANTYPSTFITSDNRSFVLRSSSSAGEPLMYYNNFNATHGMDATTSGATTGVISSGAALQSFDSMANTPWHTTPFGNSKLTQLSFQFIDWGDYYIKTQRSWTVSDGNRYTHKGFWLKTRLDSWMKQWCDHFQIPVNNTFAS